MTTREVFFIGGSGTVGRRAVRALRKLQPDLPFVIGGRDVVRAEAVAREVGNARAVPIDLRRADLGLPADASFAAVVVLMRDDTMHALRFAQERGAPYVAFADFAFELAPIVAQHVEGQGRTPLLNLSSVLGGMVATATRDFARGLRAVRAIRIGVLFDEDDHGGPAAQGDMDRIASSVPHPLVRSEGRFVWAKGALAQHDFSDASGASWSGSAVSLLDVATLAAATGAADVRVDIGVRPRVQRTGDGPETEVLVEIDGEADDGAARRVRFRLHDRDAHAGISAQGVAIGVERLLGLAGGPPVTSGLHHAETLVDPTHAVARLRALGTTVTAF